MILVPDHAALLAVQIALHPHGLLGDGADVVGLAGYPQLLHPVSFKISLPDQIETVLVAKLREPWCIWIMAGADGVHVMFLHDSQIP